MTWQWEDEDEGLRLADQVLGNPAALRHVEVEDAEPEPEVDDEDKGADSELAEALALRREEMAVKQLEAEVGSSDDEDKDEADEREDSGSPRSVDLAQEYASTFTHARVLHVCHILLLLTAAACDEIAGRRRLLHSKLRLRQRTMTMRTTRMRTTPRMMMMKRRSWTAMKKSGDWQQK